MDLEGKKSEIQSRLLERLHDPVQLRVCVTGAVLLIAYLIVYWPFSTRVSETAPKLREEQKRADLARDITHLRAQLEQFEHRLPRKTDTNEWVQYVLEGIRGLPLKLIALDSAAPQAVGPYKAVVLKIELEGTFHDLDHFLYWVASNERLFRVDGVKIAPARGQSRTLNMQLTVLGVMG